MQISEEVKVRLHDIEEGYYRIVSLLFFLIMIIFIFWVAFSAKASLQTVSLSFLPTFLLIIIVMALIDKQFYHLYYNWIIAIFLLIIFYIMGYMQILSSTVDFPLLFGLNIILCSLYLSFLGLGKQIAQKGIIKPKSEMISVKTKNQEPQPEKKEEIIEVVHSIEDRCKAINFVIGRVYGKAHGGTEEMRRTLRIDPVLYNAFNELKDQNIEEVKDHIKKILDLLLSKLALYDLPESAVFKSTAGLKKLERDEDGSDKVIDVLLKNDKDPVKNYIDAATSFCKQALKELNEQ
ncbi:hypothetical protein CMO92_05195 [Candidatus Woesearchaeota archaeon]|nr:hypothetical protein [Candidatus Woesearchaeota archaeon]